MRRRHGTPEVLVTWEGGSARFPLAGLADDEDFRTALRTHRIQALYFSVNLGILTRKADGFNYCRF